MYTDEKNAQIVLALFKKIGVKHVIVSPGTTNVPIARGVQEDEFFVAHSAIDERSAAYMACGLSSELGEPVAISCTGATASRNYMPALTEAFYRKIPLVAVTSMNDAADIGNLTTQVIDRSVGPNDIDVASVRLDPIRTDKEFSEACLRVNRVLGELGRNGGGPVRIELITSEGGAFSTKELPDVRLIKRYSMDDEGAWPVISESSKVVVAMGALPRFNSAEKLAFDAFTGSRDAVAFANMASGRPGKHSFFSALSCAQLVDNPVSADLEPDLVVQIGEMSGDYDTGAYLNSLDCPIWRISPDGEMRKTFGRLDAVFQCGLRSFFEHYSDQDPGRVGSYAKAWTDYDETLRGRCPDLPYSNIWIARMLSKVVPEGSVVHAAILSSMAAWNFFPPDNDVETSSTVGGFGIDGCVSTLIGASLADPSALHICVTGDLAFFYDMNSLGNRHVGSNVRILLVNNNVGMTFKHTNHFAHTFGHEADEFIAAGGHNVNRFDSYRPGASSPAKAWAESLGFFYLSASDKREFEDGIDDFLSYGADRPVLFECFVGQEEEKASRDIVVSIDQRRTLKGSAKRMVKDKLSPATVGSIKKMLDR